MKAKVRTSNYLDIAALYHLADEYCRETGADFNPKAVVDSIQFWLRESLVAEKDGKVIGVISCSDGREPFTGELERWCSHWFVSKDYRGRIGLELLKAANPKYINLPPNMRAPKGYKAKAIIYEKV